MNEIEDLEKLQAFFIKMEKIMSCLMIFIYNKYNDVDMATM